MLRKKNETKKFAPQTFRNILHGSYTIDTPIKLLGKVNEILSTQPWKNESTYDFCKWERKCKIKKYTYTSENKLPHDFWRNSNAKNF